MSKHLSKVYCRIRYGDGSEGPGYTWIMRDGWTIGHEGRSCKVEYKENHVEVQIEGDTFWALIDYATWGRLEQPDLPRIIRSPLADDLHASR